MENAVNLLKNEDQYKKNKDLQAEIAKIKASYKKAVSSYEGLLLFRDSTSNKNKQFDSLFASALTYLSKENYASAEADLANLDKKIADEKTKLASVNTTIAANVVEASVPPSSGYQRQKVKVGDTYFLVDVVSADLSSTKVIVDTASEGTCTNNCPVLSLADYVSRSGAFAGVNGAYFCPAEYPSCVGKTNSFDTLLMNKNKVYFNSDNNVYSEVPAAIFTSSWSRFVTKSLEWGRDTSVDAVIAMRPLLVLNGQVAFNGDGDAKHNVRSNRGFIGGNGTKVYIGVVHGVTAAESAKVLQAMGLNGALNLDSGGSTAFWSGGYKVGPGRNIPNAVLFVKR